MIVGFCSVIGSQPVSYRSLLITSLKAYVCSFSSFVRSLVWPLMLSSVVIIVVGVVHVTSSCRFSSAAWILFLFLCSFFLCLCLFLPDPSETCCNSISSLQKKRQMFFLSGKNKKSKKTLLFKATLIFCYT